jgi:hypothetical protein
VDHFWQNIPGWADGITPLYARIVADAPQVAHFVEVGSFKGRSAAFMAVEIINSGKQIKFDCVDTWQGSAEHQAGQSWQDADVIAGTLFNSFTANMAPVAGHYTAIRQQSAVGAEMYANETLDFVFIDAAHDYDSVKADITAWLPKVKAGGILAGHDWHYASVQQAVLELLPNATSMFNYSWLVENGSQGADSAGQLEPLFLNIITPCSRPENLSAIAASINIPRESYRWLVIFDAEQIPAGLVLPENCEAYAIKNPASVFGNAQRNYGLELITRGHVYFNDDDTTIHPQLWKNICDINSSIDIISFGQARCDGQYVRGGENLTVFNIDTHQFVLSRACVGEIRWVLNEYAADGIFIQTCAENKLRLRRVVLPQVLSVYNTLRC